MASLSFDLGPRRRPEGELPAAASLRPRQWQSQLIQLLRARLLACPPGGHDVLVHAGPGAGKTFGALLSFQRLRQEKRLERFVVFTHRSSIASQWLSSAERMGLRLQHWEGVDGAEGHPLAAPWDGLLITYQTAGRQLNLLAEDLRAGGLGAWMAIADEVHHLGMDPDEPEATAWGHAFNRLTGSALLRLGLTGTPFRADNLGFCAARRRTLQQGGERIETIVPDLSVEPRQLIVAGDVRPLEFRFQDGWVEHGRRGTPEPGGSRGGDANNERSPISAEERESWRARNLRRAIQLGDGSSIALRVLLSARRRLERVRGSHPEAGGLVIARDIAHARRITGLLEEEGDRVHLVHSLDPEAATRLAAFQQGAADWLVSIDMCAEGFDAPRLRVVAYLTTVVTRSRFVQAITRAVRIDGSRAAIEAVPREASYIFAPADPLLMGYARRWSLSDPYLIRPRLKVASEPAGGSPGEISLPLEAVDDRAGSVIRLGGPDLPSFLRQSA
ncbi:MAG: DEAD/DEAH box helicase family protein [Prochlorococcaceae cyanobacterium]